MVLFVGTADVLVRTIETQHSEYLEQSRSSRDGLNYIVLVHLPNVCS